MISVRVATDEDVAIRASADFAAICPRDQTMASGVDGLFVAPDPWTLRSPSTDFAASGVAPGHVVLLSGPQTAFLPEGECFAVASVGPGGLTLRRKGQGPGEGRPPASIAGLSSVEFAVRTLGPQIDRATVDLCRRLGVLVDAGGPGLIDLDDPSELTDAVVLSVLHRQFFDQARRFSANKDDPIDWYGVKAKAVRGELDDLIDRLAVRRRRSAEGPGPTPTRFSTRISR